jgi:hypothetical protein
MFASKYYLFFAPLPLFLWRRSRWATLSGIAIAAWLAINWTPLFPSTWAYLADHVAGRHVSTPTLSYMGSLYANLPLHLIDGVPWTFYFVFAAAKLTPPVLALSLAGMFIALRRRKGNLLLGWLAVWFAVFTVAGGKYGRYFVSVLPAFLLLAGHAVSELFHAARRWVALRHDALPAALQGAIAPIFAVVQAAPLALACVAFATEAHAVFTLSPHARFYVSPLFGGESRVDNLFPHCDYFDAGLREAVQTISASAEPGAEIAAAVDLPVRHYARPDLRVATLGEECTGVCYAIVQPGRVYLENRDAIAALSGQAPWAVIGIRGHAAATVYRVTGPGTRTDARAAAAR